MLDASESARECARTLSVVIPAHNEEGRINGVLDAVVEFQRCEPWVEQVIVVADCCTDATADVARSYSVSVVERPGPTGSKGAAMMLGSAQAGSEYLLFLDGDLVGLTPSHLRDICAPVLRDDAAMSLGTFDYSKWRWLVNRVPITAGERCVSRELFQVAATRDRGRYTIETHVNEVVGRRSLRTTSTVMSGVRQHSKRAKLGRWAGTAATWAMFREIALLAADIDRRAYRSYLRQIHHRTRRGQYKQVPGWFAALAYCGLRGLSALIRLVPTVS